MQKTTTIRLSAELDKQLTDYAKGKELSKNQVVKIAVRRLLDKTSGNAEKPGA